MRLNLKLYFFIFISIFITASMHVWLRTISDLSANSIDLSNERIFSTEHPYHLDNTCPFDPNFDTSQLIFGVTLEGAFDWIKHLRSFFKEYPVRSIADIPCGDTSWQFSLREINAIDQLYFGGNMSMNMIDFNRDLYKFKHQNKLFQYWDLVRCRMPTFTYQNSTHRIHGKANLCCRFCEEKRGFSSDNLRQYIRFDYHS